MKKLITLISAAVFTCPLFSQTAPDFTITATDGQVHQLYADHLNQGQTVVLEIMFTTCPPCNSFAPYLEPLNQAWGAGQHDVQFLCLSTQGFDNNASVQNWLNNHGITFFGAGADGGAAAALQPYTSGQFGPFFGTPTFVVIAPNGTVQFNVGTGQSGQSKANAINTAIANTGAMPPPIQVSIKGTVRTPTGGAVGQVKLSVLPGFPNVFTTGPSGIFDFKVNVQTGTNYQLFAEKNTNHLNGVTTFDLVLGSKHILNVTPLASPYKLIAADMNASGSITTFDLVAGRKLILAIDTAFTNNKSWRFVKAGCDPVANPATCPLDTLYTFTTNSDMNDLSIIGFKIGDLNDSANPANFASDNTDKFKRTYTFSDKQAWLEAGESVSIIFTAKDIRAVPAPDYRIKLSGSMPNFEELSPGFSLTNFKVNNNRESSLTVTKAGDSPVLQDRQPVFQLTFIPAKSGRLGKKIQILK